MEAVDDGLAGGHTGNVTVDTDIRDALPSKTIMTSP